MALGRHDGVHHLADGSDGSHSDVFSVHLPDDVGFTIAPVVGSVEPVGHEGV